MKELTLILFYIIILVGGIFGFLNLFEQFDLKTAVSIASVAGSAAVAFRKDKNDI